MIAIDCTDLSPSEIEKVGTHPQTMEMGPSGLPSPLKNCDYQSQLKERVTKVLNNPKNHKLRLRFGDEIFTDAGRTNWKKFPVEELLKRMVRRKPDSRTNLFHILGTKFLNKLLPKIPASDLKLRTKMLLRKQMERFLIKAKKVPRKRTDPATKKTKRASKKTVTPKDVIA